jgi:hypothetical protein
MEQHRKDKAQYLLKVREKVNADRIRTRKHIAGQLNDVSFTVEKSKEILKDVFNQAYEAVDLLECSHDLNKTKAITAWFNYYAHALSDFNGFKNVMFSLKNTKAITEKAQANMELNEVFTKYNAKLVDRIIQTNAQNTLVSRWHNVKENKKIISSMATKDKSSMLLSLLKTA